MAAPVISTALEHLPLKSSHPPSSFPERASDSGPPRCRCLDYDLPMRGISQAMILRWRSPLHRKSCSSIAFRAKAVACSPVCRFSRGSDIHSRMIARRAWFSGLIVKILPQNCRCEGVKECACFARHSDPGRAYKVDTCPADRSLGPAKYSLRPCMPSQPRRQQRALRSRAVDTSDVSNSSPRCIGQGIGIRCGTLLIAINEKYRCNL